jgi:hypothetical protein
MVCGDRVKNLRRYPASPIKSVLKRRGT